MIKRNQSLLNLINVVLDAILTFASFGIANFIRFSVMSGSQNNVMKLSNPMVRVYLFIYCVCMIALYYIAGLYGSFRLKRVGTENIKIMLLNLVGVAGIIAVLYIKRIMDFSRLALLFFWIFSALLIILKRAVVRISLQKMRANNKNLKHIVIVGNGKKAFQFLQNIKEHPEYGIWIDGYISGAQKDGLGKCYGSYEDIDDILIKHDFDSVVIALEPHEMQYMQLVMEAVDKEGVKVELIPFFNDFIPAHPVIEAVGSTKLIDLRATPLHEFGWGAIKRFLDFIGSLVLIILFLPLMIVTAVGVKISSPGPIFFKQERMGKDKKPFNMLKFRSMRTNIDTSGWTTQTDSRRTGFGSFIRKYSIDELPQLFNVFVGQMSLVGPRPELPKFVHKFKEDVPLYLLRQQVRPGMTGWAQVNGLRGDTSISDRVKYDIWYIENWSLGLDIKILFMTLFGGFINEEK